MKTRNTLLLVIVVIVVVIAGAATYVALTPSSKGAPPSPPSGPTTCSSSSQGPTSGNWTTYHQDPTRDGVQPVSNVASVHTEWSSPMTVDGQVYAEPLVCGNSVFVATEDDSVYAINASTGTTVWRTHLGTPMPSGSLPCGDISPTSGITGTPVIDVSTGTLYAVAFLSSETHVLFGVNIFNGSVKSQVVVDPTGANPLVEQQRGALTLGNGYVYVVYGGLDGDCGNYHGWVVGAPISGSGGLAAYQVPTHREGGIWGTAGTGMAANGSLYVATGNGDSTTTFDYGDSVIELSPSLNPIGHFAPADWAQLNSADTDLGSVAPTVLPNGEVFQIGKGGVGYLLSGSDLGGIGGQIANASVCNGAYGATAHVGFSVFVPCLDGVFDVAVSGSELSVVWQTTAFDAGSPIVTGNVVWAVDINRGTLLGFNISSGDQEFSFSLGSVEHFISPAAGPTSVYVAGGNQLYAFALSS
ncbi:MAG TPA: PQQ-binding-like beta-propeller repeat protein [Thermoplasmata archaeon]|nr:PQQ-binding-like beta-propeller repeat protein [Thermoplasmata archaeon]